MSKTIINNKIKLLKKYQKAIILKNKKKILDEYCKQFNCIGEDELLADIAIYLY